MATVKIRRTSAGLKDALFEAIEALRAGDIEPDEAKQVAGLAREIVNVTKLELDVFATARAQGIEDDEASPPEIILAAQSHEATDEPKALPKMRGDASGDDDANGPKV